MLPQTRKIPKRYFNQIEPTEIEYEKYKITVEGIESSFLVFELF
jgi:hypothetical protein